MAVSWNRVEINLEALRCNMQSLRRMVGPQVRVMAVVKADAYGHGLVPAALACRQAGADTFGVAEMEEGVRLRQAGIAGEIIVLLGLAPENVAMAVARRLSPVVYDAEILLFLQREAESRNCLVDVHLKVDVGMGRLGVLPQEAAVLLDKIAACSRLRLAGVCSHFPQADDPLADAATLEQFRYFLELLRERRAGGQNPPMLHIANSCALLRHPGTRVDMVRPGILLYGGMEAGAGETFQPVMRFVSRVAQVKELPAGWGVSYGRLHVTTRPTRVAVLPVGYDDGYLRALTGRAQVLIGGRRAPVLGRICMNACMADVSALPRVASGDEVVLLGCQGEEEIGVAELASWMNTISYEVFCLFGGRNRRVYIDGGVPIAADTFHALDMQQER